MRERVNLMQKNVEMALWPMAVIFAINIMVLWGLIQLHEFKTYDINIIIILTLILLSYSILVFKIFGEKFDDNTWLLLAVMFNGLFTLIIQDKLSLTFEIFLLDFLIMVIYILMIFISQTKDYWYNIQRLILLIIFTGSSFLYSSDFKTTVIVLAIILFTNVITSIFANKFEEKTNSVIPYLTKYRIINQILVNRYYYSVKFYFKLKEINETIIGKLAYVFVFFSINVLLTYMITPGVSLIISQIYANILTASTISYYSLLRYPGILAHTESSLDLKKRGYFEFMMKRLLTKNNLQLLAFSGAFSVPWATYTWIKSNRDENKKWATEQLGALPKHIRDSAPKWVEELTYVAKNGVLSSNYPSAFTQFSEALAKEPAEESNDFFKKQLESKDKQLEEKDKQIRELIKFIKDDKLKSSFREEVNTGVKNDLDKYINNNDGGNLPPIN